VYVAFRRTSGHKREREREREREGKEQVDGENCEKRWFVDYTARKIFSE
jgi:hypothetical protein